MSRRRSSQSLLLLPPLLGGAVLACHPATPSPSPAASPAPSPQPALAPAPADARPLVIFLGDSLTAGLGLEEAEAYPAVVGRRLAEEGLPVRVVNAGVSGDTSAGGLARLDWLLGQKPDLLVVALGANDGLRGMPAEATRANLERIVAGAQAAGARVLLAGMLVPPSYGAEHGRAFAAIFPDLAAKRRVPLVPFLLTGVAGRPELNRADGIHPNRRGQEAIAENLLPYLRPLLRNAAADRER